MVSVLVGLQCPAGARGVFARYWCPRAGFHVKTAMMMMILRFYSKKNYRSNIDTVPLGIPTAEVRTSFKHYPTMYPRRTEAVTDQTFELGWDT